VYRVVAAAGVQSPVDVFNDPADAAAGAVIVHVSVIVPSAYDRQN